MTFAPGAPSSPFAPALPGAPADPTGPDGPTNETGNGHRPLVLGPKKSALRTSIYKSPSLPSEAAGVPFPLRTVLIVAGRVRPALAGCLLLVAADDGGASAESKNSESENVPITLMNRGKVCTLASFGPQKSAVNSRNVEITLSLATLGKVFL
ncbi:unannotated protein [freshwater metagenome]|uniref:Unannotated protein n=1 Tax=freshwater metagenome TaxID=449393 RepID=A0A6J6QMQ5_9ZZZZ